MRFDAIVVGGSFAGLSAATYIARARRSVCIVDVGLPRNRFAEHSHGLLGHDGAAPLQILALARAQVAAYPTATFIDGEVISAAPDEDGFAVALKTGDVLRTGGLVLAFGISDELPPISGLPERWGKTVLHCPYCHGFEFSGKRLGVLNTSSMSILQAMLIAQWGPTTLYLNGATHLDDETLSQLQKHGVALETDAVSALHGDGAALSAIELDDGRKLDVEAIYISPPNRLNSTIGRQLGCEVDEGPLGTIIRTDALKMTTIRGVYAAGDITRAVHNITLASADGVTAGTALHRALVF